MKSYYLTILLLFPLFSSLTGQTQTTTIQLEEGHQLFFSSTLENDDLIMVSRQGLQAANDPTVKGYNRKSAHKNEFKIHRFSPDLKLKWEVKFWGSYPKIVPAGGGTIIYVIDSVFSQKETIGTKSTITTQMVMRAYDNGGSLLAKKTYTTKNIQTEPYLYLSDGLDLLCLNYHKRKAKRGSDIKINRITFGAFSLAQTTIVLPDEYSDIYWSEWRYIGETEENLLWATRKKIDNGRIERYEASHRNIEMAILTVDKNGKRSGPIKQLSLQTNAERYLKPHFAVNAFPNRDLSYLAWKIQPLPIFEFGDIITHEENTGFNTGTFYFHKEFYDGLRQNQVHRPEWTPKEWAYGNLWLNPKDNHFYFYGLTGPSVNLAGLKAAHDGFIIAQFDRDGKLQWKTEQDFSKAFQKFGYFRIHAPVGKRELDLQSQLDGKLVLSAGPRARISKKGACYLTLNEDGNMSTETIALEKDQLRFKEPLGFPRVYRWKNQIYFHSLNSKEEFVVYSKSSTSASASSPGQREVVIERYY